MGLQFQEMLSQVLHELIKKGFLKYPKVFISPACGAEVPALAAMVKTLKGEVALTQGEYHNVTYLPSSNRGTRPDVQDQQYGS